MRIQKGNRKVTGQTGSLRNHVSLKAIVAAYIVFKVSVVKTKPYTIKLQLRKYQHQVRLRDVKGYEVATCKEYVRSSRL